jgi:hypothetical protein
MYLVVRVFETLSLYTTTSNFVNAFSYVNKDGKQFPHFSPYKKTVRNRIIIQLVFFIL